MGMIPMKEVLEQLPLSEVEESIVDYLGPIMENLPDKRLKQVVPLCIQGILGSQSPVVLQMAQAIPETEGSTWAVAKRMYGLLSNKRFTHEELSEGLDRVSQVTVEQAKPEYLVVAIDPVNFEKPYTKKLEGVSIVHKSTPPGLDGNARLTPGYPSITASVVNTPVPATTYANWFSYTKDFLSQNIEIQHAIDATTRLFPEKKRRYVLDAGFDDKRWFEALQEDEFVIRAYHSERIVEVYNDRLDRWERERLGDLVDVVPFSHRFSVSFTHARKTRQTNMHIGWFKIRLPGKTQPLGVIVAYDPDKERTLTLLTNIPLHSIVDVRHAYDDWRLRSRIEHGYRFDQEQGLDVEDMRVQTLERMKRLFILVLAAAQFVFHLIDSWPTPAVQWIRSLGGKLGLDNDLDGPYVVLRGLASLFQTAVTLSFVSLHPFPRFQNTYG